MAESRHLGFEQGPPLFLAGGGHGGESAAVETVDHGDDLERAAPMEGAVFPGELDGAFVGLGAAAGEEDAVKTGDVSKQFGELQHGCIVEGGTGVDQQAALLFQGLGDDGGAVPEGSDRPAADKIEILFSGRVPKVHSLAAFHDHLGPLGGKQDGLLCFLQELCAESFRNI